MKTLLIYPPVGGSAYTGIPLGVFYLAGATGADVVDGRIEGERAVIEAIQKQYDIVGISVQSNVRWSAYGVASWVRRFSPQSKIVMGGHHATAMPSDVQRHCDVVIQGDGEGPFREYVRTGIVGKPILDINDIPSPAWDKVKFDLYPARGRYKRDRLTVNGVRLSESPLVSVLSSRGCTGSCAFCSWTTWKDYRMRSPWEVEVELYRLMRHWGQRHFEFVDDCFGDEANKIILCDLIREHRFAWRANVRPDTLTPELVKAFKSSGCYQIFMGVESGSQKILNAMHKKLDVDRAARSIRMLEAAGIWTSVGIVLGMPGETDATVRETIDFLRLTRPNRIEVNAGVMLLPGTALYQRAKREGLIDDTFWQTRESYRVYTNGFTHEDLNRWGDMVRSYSVSETFRLWKSKLTKATGYAWQKF
jgi:anaerobic magnesium-protoporphyrin IX monomethyl ester cyclase